MTLWDSTASFQRFHIRSKASLKGRPLFTAAIAAVALVVLAGAVQRDLFRKPDARGSKGFQAGINSLNPSDFSSEELQELQRRFGVHGPQTPIAQLFTQGVDQLEPLRAQTLSRLERFEPIINGNAVVST